MKIKSSATRDIRYMWFVIKSRSFFISSNLPMIQFTHTSAKIEVMYVMLGLILDKVIFDTCSGKYQKGILNPC